jgi:hypothetical protein
MPDLTGWKPVPPNGEHAIRHPSPPQPRKSHIAIRKSKNHQLIPDALGSWGYAGPAVFFWDGLWYWFTTDSGFHYITSPDLVTWTPSFFAGGDSYAVSFPAGQQEGAVIPDLYAVTAPGSLSLTNIPAVTGSTNIICTDSNGAEMAVPISNIVQGATFNGTISVSGVNTTLYFTNGLLKAHSP